MHFRHYSLRIKISFKISFQFSLKLFWSKSSMELSPEFHGTFWATFKHLGFHGIPQNLKFHGIPRNVVLIQSSMEFHGTISLLPNKSSMEFNGIPWKLINLIFCQLINFDIFYRWYVIAFLYAYIYMHTYITQKHIYIYTPVPGVNSPVWRIVPAQNRITEGRVMVERLRRWIKQWVAAKGVSKILRSPVSTLAFTSWSNSLIIGTYPAASVRRHVLMFPSYQIIYIYIQNRWASCNSSIIRFLHWFQFSLFN